MGRIVINAQGQEVYIPSAQERGFNFPYQDSLFDEPTVAELTDPIPVPGGAPIEYEPPVVYDPENLEFTNLLLNEEENERMRQLERERRQREKEAEQSLKETDAYKNWSAAMDRWMASVKEYKRRLSNWEQQGGTEEEFVQQFGPEPSQRDAGIPERPRFAPQSSRPFMSFTPQQAEQTPTGRMIQQAEQARRSKLDQDSQIRENRIRKRKEFEEQRKQAILNSPDAIKLVDELLDKYTDEKLGRYSAHELPELYGQPLYEGFKTWYTQNPLVEGAAWNDKIEGNAFSELINQRRDLRTRLAVEQTRLDREWERSGARAAGEPRPNAAQVYAEKVQQQLQEHQEREARLNQAHEERRQDIAVDPNVLAAGAEEMLGLDPTSASLMGLVQMSKEDPGPRRPRKFKFDPFEAVLPAARESSAKDWVESQERMVDRDHEGAPLDKKYDPRYGGMPSEDIGEDMGFLRNLESLAGEGAQVGVNALAELVGADLPFPGQTDREALIQRHQDRRKQWFETQSKNPLFQIRQVMWDHIQLQKPIVLENGEEIRLFELPEQEKRRYLSYFLKTNHPDLSDEKINALIDYSLKHTTKSKIALNEFQQQLNASKANLMEADRRGASPETWTEAGAENLKKFIGFGLFAGGQNTAQNLVEDLLPKTERADILAKAAKQQMDNAKSYSNLRTYLERQGYWGAVEDLDKSFEEFHIETTWQTARAKAAKIIHDRLKGKVSDKAIKDHIEAVVGTTKREYVLALQKIEAQKSKDLAFTIAKMVNMPERGSISKFALWTLTVGQEAVGMIGTGIFGIAGAAGVPGAETSGLWIKDLLDNNSLAINELEKQYLSPNIAKMSAPTRNAMSFLFAAAITGRLVPVMKSMGGVTSLAGATSFGDGYLEARKEGHGQKHAVTYGALLAMAEVAPMIIAANAGKAIPGAEGILKFFKPGGFLGVKGPVSSVMRSGVRQGFRSLALLPAAVGSEALQEAATAVGESIAAGYFIDHKRMSKSAIAEAVSEAIKGAIVGAGFGEVVTASGATLNQFEINRKVKNRVTKELNDFGKTSFLMNQAIMMSNADGVLEFVESPTRTKLAKILPGGKLSGTQRQQLADSLRPFAERLKAFRNAPRWHAVTVLHNGKERVIRVQAANQQEAEQKALSQVRGIQVVPAITEGTVGAFAERFGGEATAQPTPEPAPATDEKTQSALDKVNSALLPLDHKDWDGSAIGIVANINTAIKDGTLSELQAKVLVRMLENITGDTVQAILTDPRWNKIFELPSRTLVESIGTLVDAGIEFENPITKELQEAGFLPKDAETTPEPAPQPTPDPTPTPEPAPQYDEQGFDQNGVTEDGRIRDPDYLDSETDAPSISIEEAEQYLRYMPDNNYRGKAILNQRIEIAKERTGVRVWISSSEAARRMGIMEEQLLKMRESQEIRGFRDGDNWVFQPKDIRPFEIIPADPWTFVLPEDFTPQPTEGTAESRLGAKAETGPLTVSHVGASDLVGFTDDSLRRIDMQDVISEVLGKEVTYNDNAINLNQGQDFLKGDGKGADILVLHRIPNEDSVRGGQAVIDTGVSGAQETFNVSDAGHTLKNWRKAVAESGAEFVFVFAQENRGDFNGMDFMFPGLPGYEVYGEPIRQMEESKHMLTVLKKTGTPAETTPQPTPTEATPEDRNKILKDISDPSKQGEFLFHGTDIESAQSAELTGLSVGGLAKFVDRALKYAGENAAVLVFRKKDLPKSLQRGDIEQFILSKDYEQAALEGDFNPSQVAVIDSPIKPIAVFTPSEIAEASPTKSTPEPTEGDPSLDTKNVNELKGMAKELGIKGAGTMRKAALIEAIENANEILEASKEIPDSFIEKGGEGHDALRQRVIDSDLDGKQPSEVSEKKALSFLSKFMGGTSLKNAADFYESVGIETDVTTKTETFGALDNVTVPANDENFEVGTAASPNASLPSYNPPRMTAEQHAELQRFADDRKNKAQDVIDKYDEIMGTTPRQKKARRQQAFVLWADGSYTQGQYAQAGGDANWVAKLTYKDRDGKTVETPGVVIKFGGVAGRSGTPLFIGKNDAEVLREAFRQGPDEKANLPKALDKLFPGAGFTRGLVNNNRGIEAYVKRPVAGTETKAPVTHTNITGVKVKSGQIDKIRDVVSDMIDEDVDYVIDFTRDKGGTWIREAVDLAIAQDKGTELTATQENLIEAAVKVRPQDFFQAALDSRKAKGDRKRTEKENQIKRRAEFTETREQLEGKTKNELKEIAKDLGVRTTGNKPDIVNRILDAVAEAKSPIGVDPPPVETPKPVLTRAQLQAMDKNEVLQYYEQVVPDWRDKLEVVPSKVTMINEILKAYPDPSAPLSKQEAREAVERDLSTRADEAAAQSAIDLRTLMDKIAEGDIEIKGGANMDAFLNEYLEKNYSNGLSKLTVKELTQNSFDAIKETATYDNPGNIDISVDYSENTITVKDDGVGMTHEVLEKAFFTLGGTHKPGLKPEDRSGGFGFAKIAFQLSSEYVYVETVHDGVKSVVKATIDQLNAMYKREKYTATEEGRKFLEDNKIIAKRTNTNEPNGTTVTIKFADVDFVGDSVLDESVFIGPVNVTFDGKPIKTVGINDTRIKRDKNGKPIPHNTFNVPGIGKVVAYLSENKTDRPYVYVLSAGINQFSKPIARDWTMRFGAGELNERGNIDGYDIFFDIRPSVKAGDRTYPFNKQREDFNVNVEEVAKLTKDLAGFVNFHTENARVADVIGMSEKFSSLPIIDPNKNYTAAELKALLAEQSAGESTGPVLEGTEEGREFNPEFSRLSKKETEKRPKVANPPNHTRPVFHNNTDMKLDAKERLVVAKLANVFFNSVREIGELLKNEIGYGEAAADGKALNKDVPWSVGISFSGPGGYLGVNTTSPQPSILVNIGDSKRGAKELTPERVAMSWWQTLVHETAHINARTEKDVGSEIGKLFSHMEDYQVPVVRMRQQILDIIDNNWETVLGIIEKHEQSNIADDNATLQGVSDKRRSEGDDGQRFRKLFSRRADGERKEESARSPQHIGPKGSVGQAYFSRQAEVSNKQSEKRARLNKFKESFHKAVAMYVQDGKSLDEAIQNVKERYGNLEPAKVYEKELEWAGALDDSALKVEAKTRGIDTKGKTKAQIQIAVAKSATKNALRAIKAAEAETRKKFKGMNTASGMDESTPLQARPQTTVLPRIEVSPLPLEEGEKLGSPADIIFSAKIGRQPTKSKMKGNTLGFYKPATGRIALKYANDLDTAAHELGHFLDDATQIGDDLLKVDKYPSTITHADGTTEDVQIEVMDYSDEAKAMMGEMMNFAAYGSIEKSGPRAKQDYVVGEAIAEWIRAYLINPDATLEQAPEFSQFILSRLESRESELLDKMRAFGDKIRKFGGLSGINKTLSNVKFEGFGEDSESLLELGINNVTAFTQELVSRIFGDTGYSFDPGFATTLSTWFGDSLAPAHMGIDVLRARSGKFINPLENPGMLLRLLQGQQSQYENQLLHGPIDWKAFLENKGIVRLGSAQGVGNLQFLFAPLDLTTKETFDRDMRYLHALMIAERHVERSEVIDKKALDKLINDIGLKIAELELAVNAHKEDGTEIPQELADETKLYLETYIEANEAVEKTKFGDHKYMEGMRIIALKLGEVAVGKKAKRMINANNRQRNQMVGSGGGLVGDLEVSKQTLNEINALPAKDIARLREAAQRYRDFADAMILKPMLAFGRLSEEQYQQIKEDNQFYVNMQRALDQNNLIFSDPARAIGSTGVTNARNVIKKFFGSTEPVANIYVSLLQMGQIAQYDAQRNYALQQMAKLAESSGRKMYKGAPVDLAQIMHRVEKGDDNSIKIYIDGKETAWRMHPEIKKAFDNMNQGLPEWTILFTYMPMLLRNSITYFPAFMARNIIRDTFTRPQLSNVGSQLRDTFKAVQGAMTGSDDAAATEFMLGGGGQFGHYLKSRIDYASYLRTETNKLVKDKNVMVMTRDQISKAVDKYKDLAESSERLNRIAEFKKAKEKALKMGFSESDAILYAAYEARDLLDFAVSGTVIKWVNSVVPFTNAGVQALRRAFKQFRTDPKRMFRAWIKYSLIPELMVYGWNMSGSEEERDEYRQLPAWRKDFYYNVRIGPNFWLSIPKPYEFGVLASGVTRVIDYASGGATGKQAFEGYRSSFFTSFSPVGPEIIFGPYKPIIEASFNKNVFKGRNIVPPYEEKKKVSLREGTERASNLGQAIQSLTGDSIDARKVDHLIVGMFGTAGRAAIEMSSIAEEGRLNNWGRSTGLLVGITRDGGATNARDVVFVTEWALQNGHDSKKSYKDFRKLFKRYFEATNNRARQAAAREILAKARGVRAAIESAFPPDDPFSTPPKRLKRDK